MIARIRPFLIASAPITLNLAILMSCLNYPYSLFPGICFYPIPNSSQGRREGKGKRLR
jgi:hypothetical protein